MTVNPNRVVTKLYEEADAWVECERCENSKRDPDGYPCEACKGEGGRWHPAVKEYKNGAMYLYREDEDTRPVVHFVTKSSKLVREVIECDASDCLNGILQRGFLKGKKCEICDGSGYIPIGEWRVEEADHE